VASVCTNLDKNSTYWGQAAARYLPLGMDENAQLNHRYYFALTLRNAGIHLPTIVDNLLRVIYHLGEQNIFMSIYEEGSTDDGHTSAMLEVIKTTLEAIGIEHEIVIKADFGDPRNDVLFPMKRMYRHGGRVFQTLVMMDDDLWCAEELLELLFHSRGQGASITCSNDARNKVFRIQEMVNIRIIYIPSLQDTMSMVDYSVR
jgi:alpha-1,3-mannosyltransferase